MPPPAALAVEIVEQTAQIVKIGALGVVEFAENPFPRQVQKEKLVLAVATVFQDQTVPLRALAGVHQPPAIVHSDSGGDFDEGVPAAFHGAKGHGHMPFPGSGDIDDINIRQITQFFPDVFGAAKNGGAFATGLFHGRRGRVGALGAQIAHGRDVGEFNAQNVADEAGAASAATDEGRAHPGLRRGRKLVDRLLAGGAGARLADARVQGDSAGEGDGAGAALRGAARQCPGHGGGDAGQRGLLQKIPTGRIIGLHGHGLFCRQG